MRAFRVAYDGRPYHGFQRQPTVPTVEDTMFDALRELGVLDATADKPSGYAAAGRTDRRVSAVAQTVAFDAPDWLVPRALNSELPESVRAWAHADAPPGFHATHDAASRTYTYHLHAPAADVGRAGEACDRLAGEHDFHDLTTDDRNTVRALDVRVEPDGEFLVLTVRAGGFSRNLVRRVGALVRAVATGEAPLAKVDRVLAPEPLDGPEGIGPAPAAGLVLTDVEYPDLDFEVDEAAATSAREVFEGKRVAATTAARAAGEVGGRIG
ncbi:tRNA pseudouridine(38-40) synthase TruA [Halococcus hamelinensis]|uniref:tRNA pseudouridine synthase A n=1 Tax=Halococcus hamelinensis 100A6 TaxID=1132509 RepID=M0M467_9EURY|nr:tRNA pseudouridine(38-40) synthase TruA [Halococcus hamelinensis]EMA40486.1 tRNA pseudouridine synthase A [Halococcus hamelinensis 100A6]